MQTIIRSSNLHELIRKLAMIDKHKVVSLLNDRKWIDSYMLSNEEIKAIKLITIRRQETASVDALWM